ncbi:hypothetical protein ACTXT7_011791 [Hymenolepis weldensis]
MSDYKGEGNSLPALGYNFKISKSKVYCLTTIVLMCIIFLILNYHSHSAQDLRILAFRSSYRKFQSYGGCSHHTCFNVRSCVYEYPDEVPNQLRIYVYPEMLFVDENRNYITYRGNRQFKEMNTGQNHLLFGSLYDLSFGRNLFDIQKYPGLKIVASDQVVLSSSVFCLIEPSQPPMTLLFDTMKAGCIPVFTSSDIVLPFSEKVDWTKCSLIIPHGQLENVMDVIFSYSFDEVDFLQQMVEHVYNKYMSSLTAIVTATLDIINSRVFPEASPSYYDWNDPHSPSISANLDIGFLPLGKGICNQFTVLLTTSHHPMYTVSIVNFLSASRYVREVFVVYSGESAHFSSTFIIGQMKLPVKIVSPSYNTLEQTTIPLPETHSGAFLYVGEDTILPSNISDVDFAYEAWCQHPNRVVTLSPSTKTLKSTAAFFHKLEGSRDLSWIVYAVRVLELLPTSLNGLVSGEKPSCIETMLPELVAHISGRPVLPVSASWPSNITQASVEVSAHRKRCIQLLADYHLFLSENEQKSKPSFPQKWMQRLILSLGSSIQGTHMPGSDDWKTPSGYGALRSGKQYINMFFSALPTDVATQVINIVDKETKDTSYDT